ncbi:MAG: PDZ domain-containing protein [Planctomycetota bacterium]|jgi:S1-C subfamily serine protease
MTYGGNDKPGDRPGAGIHSEKFGYLLQKEMKKFDISCEVRVGGESGGTSGHIEFFLREFRKKQSGGKGGAGRAPGNDAEKAAAGRLGILRAVAGIPEEARGKHGLAKEQGGILVEKVLKASPAAKAKIREDDIIIEFDGKPIPAEDTLEGFEAILARAPGGRFTTCVILRIARSGESWIRKTVRVKLPD